MNGKGQWGIRGEISAKAPGWDGDGVSVLVSPVPDRGRFKWAAVVSGLAADDFQVAAADGRMRLYPTIHAAISDVAGLLGEAGAAPAVSIEIAEAFVKTVSADVITAAQRRLDAAGKALVKAQALSDKLGRALAAAGSLQNGNAAQQAAYADLAGRVATVAAEVVAIQGAMTAAQAVINAGQ